MDKTPNESEREAEMGGTYIVRSSESDIEYGKADGTESRWQC